MRLIFQTCLVMGVLLFSMAANAQKWEKYIDKYNKFYEKGDFKKSLSINEKFRKKSIKKLGAKNMYIPFVNLNYAKLSLQKGELMNVEKNLTEAVEVSREVNKTNPGEHSRILLLAIELYLELGSVRLAHDIVNEYRDQFGESMNADIKARLLLFELEILLEKGFYNETVELARSSYLSLVERANEKSIKKDERNFRNRQFAALINIAGEAFIRKGNYQGADSTLKSNTSWIEKNLSKGDPEYALHSLALAWSTDLQRNYKEAEKLFDDAYSYAKSGRNNYDRFTLKLHYELIKAYHRHGKDKKYTSELESFQTLVKTNYSEKTSVYQVYYLLGKLYPDIATKNSKSVSDALAIVNDVRILPQFHKTRLVANDYLLAISQFGKDAETGKANLEFELAQKENLYGEDSPEYHLALVKRGIHLLNYTNDIKGAEEAFDKSWEQVVRMQMHYSHPMYIEIYNELAVFYELNDKYKKAEEALDKAFDATTRTYDRTEVNYANAIVRIANLLTTIGEYSKSERYLDLALEVLDNKRKEGNNIIHYVNGLETKARLYSIKGMYDEAEDLLLSTKKMLKKSDITHYDMTVSDEETAKLYINMGMYATASEILKKSILKKEKGMGVDSKSLIEPLAVYGKVRLISGDYTEAEKFALKSHSIAEKVYGSNNSKKIVSLILMAEIYSTLGDFDKAEGHLENAVKIHLNVFGEDHLQLSELYQKLALVKLNRNEKITEVKTLLEKSKKILLNELDESNPLYAELLKDQAYVLIANKEYSEAFSVLLKAEHIWINKAGKRNNINAAGIYMFLGDVYYMLKNYGESKVQFTKARNLYNKFFSQSHPEYVKSLAKLSKVEYMTGNTKASMSLIEEVLVKYDDFIKNYFPALSEREKARFWNTIKDDYEFYNTLVLKTISGPSDKPVEKLYNNALNTKALLLSSSIKMRENILKSGNEELIEKYSSWLESKELLTNVLSMSTEQLTKHQINQDSLVREVELLEKYLSQESDLFSANTGKSVVSWENVKSSLKENEVAVEMVRFRYFDHVFTDSILYAALTLRNEGRRDRPELVLLSEGKSLETKYFRFYKNMIVYRMEDDLSYEKFWRPIEEKVGKNTTVYLSPDGVFNQINLEAIRTEENKYVLDNSNIILVSNTKDIYLKGLRPKKPQSENRALMFGDPEFYVSTKPAITKGTPLISGLPGTEKEVETLHSLLEKKGWKTDYFLQSTASEAQVKLLDNPTIFHIATHGFYTPQEEITEQISLDEVNEARAVENPLLRSGLMMTGAGDVLSKTKYNYNIENGILTAYEAMNLNLDYTDLVVLSACETGVGDVTAGEGVYGLQRAFLVAGAKTLIMSLFKVSDEVTNELMVSFYDKWLSTGEMRSSFIQAKKEIRNKYQDPIYWGAFIMFGME